MKPKYLDLAKKMARKSTHPQHKIGGVIVQKNKIVSLGCNHQRTHPKSNHPYKNIHCELDCILGVNPEYLMGATIYLYREDKNGFPSISKPCQWCRSLLISCGIKDAVYSFQGSFKQEKIG